MPRLLIKGGIWRNTEDEILKAAVMKYGKNQWARIASLLHRKSAKQCKSRWYEWLDPSVKKTEWSREEEEKLLHLARLFPTQWRTIAPLVGRTAAQCIEHYEYLLDRAQQKEDGSEDPRRLRPGEIDPNPETKPARPDPVDMDEDELEMLAEARARLANTQGKKAKRKARERQMDEARRLASLQKRRELRAAGIVMRKRRRQKWGIDYNEEIPFEKKVPSGFYDTSEETAKALDVNWKTLSSDKIESMNSKEREHRARQKDAEKLEKRKESNMPAVIFSQTGVGAEPAKKRSKLVLPAPQITDEELEQVVKIGMASEAARREAEASGLPESATHELLGDYTVTPSISSLAGGGSMLPPARTPATEDNLLKEAHNLFVMATAETPLKGGSNEPLHATDISTPAESRAVASTPNTVLGLPFRTPQAPGTAAPAGGMTPSQRAEMVAAGKTPLRDSLNINAADGFDMPTPSSTSDRFQQRQQAQNLRDKLKSLPAPRNDFEIVLPDEEDANEKEVEEEESGEQAMIEDMSDLERQIQEEEEAKKLAEFRRRSQVIQRSLPRPITVNDNILRPPEQSHSLSDMQRAEELIKAEMLVMLHYDALQNPMMLPKGAPKLSTIAEMNKHTDFLKSHPYKPITDADIEQAKQMLSREMANVKAMVGHGDLSIDAYSKVWEECYAQVLYVPSQQHFTRTSIASKKERIESLEKRLDLRRQHMSEEAKRAGKLEKKLRIILGGYQQRHQNDAKQISDLSDSLEQARIELSTFSLLRQHEVAAMPRRIAALREDVDRQQQRERQLQEKYDRLVFELEAFRKLANNNNPAIPGVESNGDTHVNE